MGKGIIHLKSALLSVTKIAESNFATTSKEALLREAESHCCQLLERFKQQNHSLTFSRRERLTFL